MSRMLTGAVLLVNKLPDEVSIETVRSTFSAFGDVKWVDINKSAAEVFIFVPAVPLIHYGTKHTDNSN